MALIENTVGELPYKLRRLRPALLRVRRLLHPVHAQGQDRHGDLPDPQRVAAARCCWPTTASSPLSRPTSTAPTFPGRWSRCSRLRVVRRAQRRRAVLRADADRVPRSRRPPEAAGRAADRALDHVPRRLGADGRGLPRRRRSAVRQPRVVQPLDRRGLGLRLPGPDLRARPCCRCATSTAPCAELDRVLAAGARFIMLAPGPAYGRSPGRPVLRPVLGPGQRGEAR